MMHDTYRRNREAREALAAEGKRGSKVVTTHAFDMVTTELVTTLRLFNVRKREVKTVEFRDPSTPHGVRHIMDGSTVTCRGCGGDQFHGVGRSLHYENWVCATCGRECSTLTETGAST